MRKLLKIAAVIVLTASTFTLSAQKKSYSSLQTSFRADSAEIYLDSARYYTEKTPLKAVQYINKAIELSISEKNTANEAAAYIVLGEIQQQQLGKHDQAITSYKKSINLQETKTEKKNKGKAEINNLCKAHKQIAISYLALNSYSQAETYIEKALVYSSNLAVTEKMDVMRLSAAVKSKQKKTNEAVLILNDVLKTEKKNGNLYGEVVTEIALGKVYEESNNNKQAISYYTTAKNNAEKNKLNKLAIEANDCLASVYREQKDVVKEVQARNSIIELNKSKKNKAAVSKKENLEMGNAYYNANQVEKAEEYYEKARQSSVADSKADDIDMALGEAAPPVSLPAAAGSSAPETPQKLFEKSKDLETSSSAYKQLTEEYLKRNEVKKAADYFKQYAELQDSLKKTQKEEYDNAIEISNILGQNQQKIELLEQERTLKEKSIEVLEKDKKLREEQVKNQKIIIGVLATCILLILATGYFIYRSFVSKRKVHQILALKSLRGQMNPHFIFNALNSVNHYIAKNDERLANRYLSDFSKLMRLVMDSSKHDFISMSEELEMLKIYLQLEHLRFSDKFEYNISFKNEVELMEYEIPPMLVQPYIENAIWHGLRYIDEKGSLSIEFEAQNNNLLITISDNGIGRKKSKELKTLNQKKQQSVGMQNIESRIELMNEIFDTRISVEVSDKYPDAEYSGTIVKLSIPQKHPSNA